jgi:hypothetical protein
MARTPAALVAALVVVGITAQTAPAKKVEPAQAPVSNEVAVATASATVTGDGGTATATATCPGGTKAAGGGFDAPSSADVFSLVYESVKVGKRAWRASVQLYDPNDPTTVTLTTYVYCRARFPNTKTSTETVPTSGELEVGPTASASCPNGGTALAGGFQMPSPLGQVGLTALFFDSLRSGVSGWDARVVTGTGDPSALTSEVYCASGREPPVEFKAQSAPIGVSLQTGTATAQCPRGLIPAAGGFAQPESTVESFFFVYSSRQVGDSWEVSGLHAGDAAAVALTAAAYCA